MRPTPDTAAAVAVHAGFRRWNSPIPYLFGGLGVMLALITIALVILACSFKKSRPSEDVVEEKPGKPVDLLRPEMEPKIVVIMAGDDMPTYLAKPVDPTLRRIEQV